MIYHYASVPSLLFRYIVIARSYTEIVRCGRFLKYRRSMLLDFGVDAYIDVVNFHFILSSITSPTLWKAYILFLLCFYFLSVTSNQNQTNRQCFLYLVIHYASQFSLNVAYLIPLKRKAIQKR